MRIPRTPACPTLGLNMDPVPCCLRGSAPPIPSALGQKGASLPTHQGDSLHSPLEMTLQIPSTLVAPGPSCTWCGCEPPQRPLCRPAWPPGPPALLPIDGSAGQLDTAYGHPGSSMRRPRGQGPRGWTPGSLRSGRTVWTMVRELACAMSRVRGVQWCWQAAATGQGLGKCVMGSSSLGASGTQAGPPCHPQPSPQLAPLSCSFGHLSCQVSCFHLRLASSWPRATAGTHSEGRKHRRTQVACTQPG